MVEGVRWVYGATGLARLAVSTHVWFAGNAILGVVVAPYALLVLGLSPLGLGLAAAAGGVGAPSVSSRDMVRSFCPSRLPVVRPTQCAGGE